MWLFLLHCLATCTEASVGMTVHKSLSMNCRSIRSTLQRNWTDCIMLCANNETCVAAQTRTSMPFVCQTCAITNLTSIGKTSSQSDQIALKTSSKNVKGCTSFKNGTFNGYFNNTSNLTQYKYTTKLSKDGTSWSYSYSVTKICPDKWKYFNRSLGGWCIQIGRAHVTQSEATKLCKKVGAVLTGLESEDERNYIWNTANQQINEEMSMIWLGGIRQKKCHITGPKQFPVGCNGINGFDFEDKLLSKKNGYRWEVNNPDGLQFENSGIYQDCLALWIRPNNNLIDDAFCSAMDNSYNLIRGYACGKEAG